MSDSQIMALRGPIECAGYGKRPGVWRRLTNWLLAILCAVGLYLIATTDRCERADKRHTACAK